MASIVLWPEGTSKRGCFYGWTSPVVCVAGVLDTSEAENAAHALQQALQLARFARVRDLCGSDPVLLGRCDPAALMPSQAPHSLPRLRFLDNKFSSHKIIAYRRPNLGKLEIHTLDDDFAHLVPTQTGAAQFTRRQNVTSFFSSDPTSPRRKAAALLDQRSVHQMNYGQLYEQQIMHFAPKALFPLRDSVAHVGTTFASLSTYSQRIYALKRRYPMLVAFGELSMERSAICHQVGTRLNQLLSLPGNFPTGAYNGGIVSLKSTAQYMAFYNCVWLILNDIIIGWAVSTFLRENAHTMASVGGSWLRVLLIDNLQWTLLWLNSWPAGLKLNTELSQFLCHSLLTVVIAWNRVLDDLVLPNLEKIVWISGYLGCCGATLAIAIFADLLTLLTVHAFTCYSVLRAIYEIQLSILGSLWYLFRGKRYNALRRRVDSWAYEVDQLLFGTILFTLVAFLSPTTITYYALFAVIRLGTIAAYAISDVLLVLINEFPLFALLLRAKDPLRLPAGIAYVLGEEGQAGRLKSEIISLDTIFAHYATFFSAFSEHYHPSHLVRQLAASTPLTHLTIKTLSSDKLRQE